MRIFGIYRVYTIRSRRGFVFITALWIILALTAVVLVLCREMVVESLTTRQHLSQARADAAEIGVEQYVLSVVYQELVSPGYKDTRTWEQRQLGDSYFWVITYNVDDPDEATYAYGLTDEASKVDINTWPVDSLELLPEADQYPNIGAEIVDWRDADDDVTISASGGQGEESNDYMATYGYSAKNAPFESVDEIKLLDGVDDVLLHGADLNHNEVIDPAEAAAADPGTAFETSKVGMLPFITVYGVKATNPDTASMAITTTPIYSPIANLNLTDTSGNPIIQPIDINTPTTGARGATSPLQQVLQLELPAKATAVAAAITMRQGTAAGASGTGNQFSSLFDLAASVRPALTSQDLTAIYPYLTTIQHPPKTPAAATTTPSTVSTFTQVGMLNINTASKAALMCLPGFEESDADAIIAQRQTVTVTTDANGVSQISNIAWLMDIVDPAKLKQAGRYITGSSTIFSADIVTVSQDGRAFKRVKIVVDASTGTPLIIYRRDLTAAGWPLNPQIRDDLRKGKQLSGAGATDGSTPGGRLSMGVH